MAPADYHLLVESRGRFALSTEAPVLWARPSIDVLFETAAEAYGEGVIGVILTGASADGSQGLRAIRARGGCALVQEPADGGVRRHAARRARGDAGEPRARTARSSAACSARWPGPSAGAR